MTKARNPIILFHFDYAAFALKNRKRLKHFIARIFESKKKNLAGLTYVFTTDRYLLKINRKYLDHDFYTDVIAFDLSETPAHVQGEIYISMNRVRQNASIFKVSLSEELHRVMFHAALHLCGYGDKTAGEKETMKKEEDRYLAQYFKLFHVKQST